MFDKKRLVLYIFAIILFNASCYKDSEFENVSSTEIQQPEVLNEFTGSVLGYVYDEDNQPIANAVVATYAASTTTDEFGVFSFKEIQLDAHGTYLKVTHPEYMLGSDFINATTGQASSRVQMIKLTNDNTFDASQGKLVNINGGGTIEFNANSIIDSDNNEYSGMVQVSSKLIAANDDNISDLMPGRLWAVDNRGATVSLGTAGMMAIELRSPSGDELNIKPGTTAQISLPIDNDALPGEIPTWSFNESIGQWQEEGLAIKDNDFYVFDVPHLSFWNCDYPFDMISVSGRVVNTNGEPVMTRVGVRSEMYGVEYALTDSDGFFSGKVPANEDLEFSVYGLLCVDKIFVKNLGPFSATTVLEDFVVDHSLVPNIIGQVECSGNAYSDATVIVEANGKRHIYNVINNGDFEFNPNLICDNLTTGLIWAYDNVSKFSSPQYPIDFENPVFPPLDICEVICDFGVDVKYECSIPVIELSIVNPDGTYSYAWDTGETLDVIFVPTQSSGIFCVTVTEDNTGCTISVCQETSALSATLFADECAGFINVDINNGSAPFTVTNITTGEVIDSNSPNVSFSYFVPDEYCFNITDKTGCEVSNLCVMANDPFGSQDYIDYNPYTCSLNKYYYNTTLYNYAFVSGPQGAGSIEIDNVGFFINVAEIGYKDIWVDFQSLCGTQADITTPFFEGLGFDATATNASCASCSDAQISYTVDPLANCLDCDYGEVKIFDNNFIDRTNENTNAMLSIGTYYVAALDLNTGCFIASQKIEIINN